MTSESTAFDLVLTAGAMPHECTSFVPGSDGARLAEHAFEWRAESPALWADLSALAKAAISGQRPEHDLHVRFGRQLFKAAFGGAVGEMWRARLSENRRRRQPTPLRLRIDPATARPLLNLPWEYLHDGDSFLALNWRTPISRLPWGIPAEMMDPIVEPLRVLVVIAAPRGLDQNSVLNTAREEDIILASTAELRRKGMATVEFAANGSLEEFARMQHEVDPHVLHFTGHGVFDRMSDAGYLLMETPDGHERRVPNEAFADVIEREARSLRFVFLSACQSAVAPTRNEAYADLAPRLLELGAGGVVAMQFSVLNQSAMDFGGAFYRAVAEGKPLDDALTIARTALAQSGLNSVDFATPVLFCADPHCLRQEPDAGARQAMPVAASLAGVAVAQHFVGRSAELRTLQTALDPATGTHRAAIIHGLGGMGKSVLATRLAQRMATRFDGVKAIRFSPTTTAHDVIEQLHGYLQVNRLRFSSPAIDDLGRIKDEPVPIEEKAAHLIAILQVHKLLLILDNMEDVLPEGHAVSTASQHLGDAATDPALIKLISLLVEGVAGPSRFVFTCRVAFEIADPGRLSNAVLLVPLGGMQFRDAVYLMETLPPLNKLPVAVSMALTVPAGASKTRATTMRDVFSRVGGHPFTLSLFARHAHRKGDTSAAIADLAGVSAEVVRVTLLDKAAAQLSNQARSLLRAGSVFSQPIPHEGFAYLVGDERDCMPDVSHEIGELTFWGLLERDTADGTYIVPAIVQDWLSRQLMDAELRGLQRRAAGYWLTVGKESTSLEPYLFAHDYLFAAGDYEPADDIVQLAFGYLRRWGQIEHLVALLAQSIRTTSGQRRAVAQGNLAIVYQGLGDYESARRMQEAVLHEFEQLGDRRNIANSLGQLGILHYLQGEYDRARERYEQALEIARALGDQAGIASGLHQLGMLHQNQGEYDRARELTEQALEIKRTLGDQAGVARSLGQLGILHQMQGEYARARELTEQALEIEHTLGDQTGIADSLHQLGNLHYLQGEYDRARECYEQALEIRRALSDQAGIASILHQLGMLHYLQGEYDRARERYQQSLEIRRALSDQAGVASSLHQLGILHQRQGEYGRARELTEQALKIERTLGDQAGVASSLHQLGILHYLQGEYDRARELTEQALEIARALGDQAGIASGLHQLGMLHQDQGEYDRARELTEQALEIKRTLGDQAGIARSLGQLGILHYLQGEYARARELTEQALEIARALGNQTGIADSLHQLGNLHYLQGEYDRARECYEQSLEIRRALSDQAGIARSLGQLGLLAEQQGDASMAVTYLVQAFVLFDRLGAPERETARHALAQLREQMGEDAFELALKSAQANTSAPLVVSRGGMTRTEVVKVILANTVAVLTTEPGQKGAWWEALNVVRHQATTAGDETLAQIAALAQRVVEGENVETLAAEVPAEFASAWADLVRDVSAN